MVDTSTEAVTKLLDEVTPGPWAGDPRFSTIVAVEKCIAEVFTSDADASFIAAARDLVPALLAERDALKAERDEAIEGWHVIHPNITVQDAARVLVAAVKAGVIDPFDCTDLAVEALAIKHAGNRRDGVGQLEIAEEFFVAALTAIAEGRA